MSNSKSNVNASMLDLFKAEIDTQSQKIITLIDQVESTTDLPESYESLINAARACKGAINLVNVNIATPIIEALENAFSHLQSQSIQTDKLTRDILKQTVSLLQQISSMSAAELNSPDNKLQQSVSSCCDQLDIILSQKNSAISDAPDESTSESTPVPALTFSTAENIDSDMFALFTTELQNSLDIINNNLLDIEANNNDSSLLEAMMRAAHSIKGAARMVGIESVVKLSHAMEDVFVAAQNQQIQIDRNSTNHILSCTDLLKTVECISSTEVSEWTAKNTENLISYISELVKIQNGESPSPATKKIETTSTTTSAQQPVIQKTSKANTDSMVRVSTRRINKLVSLAGELSVSSIWIKEYAESMLSLKRKHNDMLDQIERLRSVIDESSHSELQYKLITDIQHKAEKYRDKLTSHIFSLDDFDRRSSNLTAQINHEIISSRMRPFSDSSQGYKRMVRDISHSLNKQVELEIKGEHTSVDRDILEKLDAPLNHMIRNAIDHGIETPAIRLQKGKPETGKITISASHQGGRLRIQVKDDGRGVDLEDLREKVLKKKLVNEHMAETLSKSELLDFLFLPSFSTKKEVTELSGRGVGLDIVHSALQEVRGKLHADTELDQGMEINMELPLTLSVIRSLLVSINAELYAFPLAKIQNILTVSRQDISTIEDKQYITFDDKHIGLIHCSQIIGLKNQPEDTDEISVVIIGDWNTAYGLVVDKLIGEKGLALRTLNSRLGKVKDISAAALTDTGEPVLIFDTDDLLQSIHDIASGKDLYKVGLNNEIDASKHKRVLVVDDSLTVREIEKKLLESRGYLVDIAIDGVDGWNTIRTGQYDLVISDIDMPRMNGIELIKLIKNDAALRKIPVMMVSYKDRPEDKQSGLEAGADYYLTKGSFHDDTLLDAVVDLIGEA